MTDQIPNNITLNGVMGRPGKFRHALSYTPEEIQKIFLKGNPGLPDAEFRKRLSKKTSQPSFDLAFGLNANLLKDAGWSVVFPSKTEMNVPAVREALSPLLGRRQSEAGEIYKEILGGETGIWPNDTVPEFMERNNSSRGTVKPRPDNLPYYILLVGSPQDIPYRFQYELDATYLVGRIYFNTLDEYHQYARSVVAAEENELQLPRRAVFFGARHDGDPATEASSDELVKPLARELAAKADLKNDWNLEYLTPDLSRRETLEGLLGKPGSTTQAPAFLFTATHGMVFELGDDWQAPLQGALLCQDLESVTQELQRDHYLGAENIADDFNLHGLIAFHFACFGAGTPKFDNFAEPGQDPAQIANQDFLSALPKRLLSHPKGSALAVVGHIDRAWTYSFRWGEAGPQPDTFVDTLHRLMAGFTIGNSLDQFNKRYAQLATTVSNWYDQSEFRQPSTEQLLRDWTANNDARGYAVLGDPAVKLAVAKPGAQADRARDRGVVELVSFIPGASTATSPQPGSTPSGGDERHSSSSQAENFASIAPAAPPAAGGSVPYVYNNNQGGVVNINNYFGTSAPQTTPGRSGQGADSFGGIFGRPKEGEPQNKEAEDVRSKLQKFVQDLGEKLQSFAEDVTTLEVNTYVSSDLSNLTITDGKFVASGAAQLNPRARTVIKFDGDTEIVVPSDDAGEIDQGLWMIHAQTVGQAQEYRTAMIRALGDFISGFFPGG